MKRFPGKNVICQGGNIIGGRTKASTTIQAKNIGNRMNTVTYVAITLDSDFIDAWNVLQEEKTKLTAQIKQLDMIRTKTNQETLSAEKPYLVIKVNSF